MLKLLTFPGIDDDGNIFVQAITPGDDLVKTASGELHPEIANFISGIKKCPDNLYVLVNALGAGEYYGSNINGDYFEEAELNPSDQSKDAGFRTFLSSGIYRHHRNKDYEKSLGQVVCATYNPVMHRVELILRINRAKAKQEGHLDLVDKLDNGGHPAVSMGCKVKYDVCSICGHKSRTRADYCAHTKTMMGKVFPDGRKVFVYNPKPRFFDLSFVVIGADRTSFAMAKVASAAAMPSALAAEEYGIRDGHEAALLREKIAKKQKVSKILKQVPAMSTKIMGPVGDAEPDIPDSTINQMSKHPLKSALTTSAASGIVLKPSEFQKLVLTRMGKGDLANKLHAAKQVFSPTNDVDKSVSLGGASDYSPKLGKLLSGLIPERSMFGPALIRRITIITRKGLPQGGQDRLLDRHKLASGEKALLNKIAAGYNGYRLQLMENIKPVVDNITSRDMTLLSAINEQGLEDSFMDQGKAKTARVPLALIGALPMAYLYGAHVRKKRGSGLSTGPLDAFVEKHPILATSLFVGLTRLGMGLKSSGLFNAKLTEAVAKLT